MGDLREFLGKNLIVIDGAMGTMLQRAGMLVGECPEAYNIAEPEMVSAIHRFYKAAGAHALTTNTFGGSRPKLAEHGLQDQLFEINKEAVKIARAETPAYVFANIGPTGEVLEPLGKATFDELFEVFVEQTRALVAGEPDAILIATMTDIAEARCALLAAKSVCDLPVIVDCTFNLEGRMELSGTSPATAAIILEACGADAVGMNCGLGPEQMLTLLEEMVQATSLPVAVEPNAGLPQVGVDGETVFPGTPDKMAEHARKFYEAGAALVGSCCGSTPAFTAAIYGEIANLEIKKRGSSRSGVFVAGPRRHVRIGGDEPVCLIGERINPTGKKELADSLREGSLSKVRLYAEEQERAGANLLDVNVGAAGVDGVAILPAAVNALSGSTPLPLVIDTTDPVALEAALRAYPGRALINSVSGEEESLKTVLPLAKKYGAAVVVLALDDEGIPATAEARLAVVEKVRERAHQEGLKDSSLVVDSLVMTAAAEPSSPRITLETLGKVRQMGLATVLGVSNVSHGLPNRSLLNTAFVGAAIAAGVTSVIVNPNDESMVEAIKVAQVHKKSFEESLREWDAAYSSVLEAVDDAVGQSSIGEPKTPDVSPSQQLTSAIVRGDADGAPTLVDVLVGEGVAPGEVISNILTPAIQSLGDGFGKGEVFLPQMMVAAEAMKVAVARAKEHMPEGEDDAAAGKVAFCTVAGDIHSIGKNICVSMLESQGFLVNDLGVDVATDVAIEAAKSADVVCLSALMTTTLPAMKETTAALLQKYPQKAVFVGGAVVTKSWAESVGARYTKDAAELVNEVRLAVGDDVQ